MKAIQAAGPGGPDVLHMVEVARPEPGPGQILVRVQIAGVNFADTMQRRDAYFTPVAFPFTPGVEVAGVVSQVGPGVESFRAGDRVAGVRLGGGGGYAEYAVLNAEHSAVVPEGLALEPATAVLNQGLTAQGLIETAPEIAQGASVLVTAAGGGVGGMLLQLARLGGAGAIIGAASEVEKIGLAAGVDAKTVSYAKEDWPKQVRALTDGRGVGVVLDAVGGAVRAASVKATASRGRIVYYGAASGSQGITGAVLTQMLGKTISLTGYSIYTSILENPEWLAKTLDRLFTLAASGRLLTPIHPTFNFADAASAHAALEARTTTGKVLIRIATS